MRGLRVGAFLPALLLKSSCFSPSIAFHLSVPAELPHHSRRPRFSMAGHGPASARALSQAATGTSFENETSSSRPVRILALHGFSQDGDFFRKKTGSLRKGLKGELEMVYIDAPCIDTHSTIGEGRSWYEFSKVDENGNMVWEKFEDTLVYLDQVFREQGPFDAVLGFSQGACVTAMLAALQEHGEAPPHVRFTSCLLFSGFLPKDAKWSAVCARRKVGSVRSLHVIGEKDELVKPPRSVQLAEMFEEPSVVWHNKGHLVPSDKSVRDAFRAFIFPSQAPAASPSSPLDPQPATEARLS